MIKYQIVEHSDKVFFCECIEDLLEYGWQLVGGVQVQTYTMSNRVLYTQALWRENEGLQDSEGK